MGLKVALDTSIFIYFLEQHPQYFADCQMVLSKILQGDWEGSTSVLSIGELLVMPFRIGHTHAVNDYARFVREFSNLQVWNIDETIMTKSAQLRASFPSLKTPDALHLATVLEAGADCFITNDARLAKLSVMRIIMLQDVAHLS